MSLYWSALVLYYFPGVSSYNNAYQFFLKQRSVVDADQLSICAGCRGNCRHAGILPCSGVCQKQYKSVGCTGLDSNSEFELFNMVVGWKHASLY